MTVNILILAAVLYGFAAHWFSKHYWGFAIFNACVGTICLVIGIIGIISYSKS